MIAVIFFAVCAAVTTHGFAMAVLFPKHYAHWGMPRRLLLLFLFLGCFGNWMALIDLLRGLSEKGLL